MNDLISRQAEIDALDDVSKHYTEKGRGWHPHVDLMIYAIKELPSAQQWIPVTERLPDNTRTVLTTFIEDGVAKVDTLYYFREPLGWTDFRYNEELGRPKSFEVTAWMELPEPWKEQKDE